MSAAVQPMSIRVKHTNQTYFVPCTRSSSFLEIKEQISLANGKNAITAAINLEATNIQLLLPPTSDQPSKELPDLGTISDHMIENDQLIYTAFRKEGGSWEDVDFGEKKE
ncbi:hypothetical protein TrLO_g11048 [Triparma laevis f. longispina]|uniref:Ubiquitin-like domain-containing protein n=1 Tax=Triparma laevis f. longispina TaxID=1714387 RepID=A0A9W7CF76_9STRA|nr:hypothetical protein TrLO_g11048 [Triparma laevis f. longispina]